MIKGENKILQAFLGTLITWALTAAGSAMVFFFACGCCKAKQKILDVSLGFAAGVMIAASFWSLMTPALDMAAASGIYGKKGEFAFGPAGIGFLLGGVFVLLCDLCVPRCAGKESSLQYTISCKQLKEEGVTQGSNENGYSSKGHVNGGSSDFSLEMSKTSAEEDAKREKEQKEKSSKYQSWKRILLLLIAITVHNIPEGLAVGVGFGAIGKSPSATFEAARNLAIAIGIQNFPEGMAVSIPLCSAGYSPIKSFIYGQFSGMVEPVFGVLGALIVVVAEPLLPYALAFAAGAMIYVVVDDIIPEAVQSGNGRLATWGTMIGFTIMMCLDVGLAYI